MTLLAILLVVESSVWCAAPWKLILKSGSVIECDGAPLIINDIYMFRQLDGKSGRLAADQVDRDRTDEINRVDRRKWRVASESAGEQGTMALPGSSSGGILTLRDADFDAQVLQSHTPVMVEFLAAWCGYCKKFEPTIQAIAGEYAGRVRVGQIDIDQSPATAHRYRVSGTPTVLLFKDGKVVGTIGGFTEKSEVVRMLQSSL